MDEKKWRYQLGGGGDGGRECTVFANVFPCKRIARVLKNLCRKNRQFSDGYNNDNNNNNKNRN